MVRLREQKLGTNDTVDVDAFIPFMRDVVRCEGSLRELNLMWRLIESSAKMNCPEEAHSILPMMTATREGFQQLEADLVRSLVEESIGEVMAELGTNAHHVIDIVVRNLYERTADVGFLATDQDLCRFLANQSDDRGAVLARLREYRNKYTVYDEIMLIDVHGAVVAQIDESSPVEGTQDSLLRQTLQSSGYVETFRATDLRPGKRNALLYSHRMLHPDTGEAVGVLCLGFAFEDELRGVFHARSQKEPRQIQLLVDGAGRVIASGDPLWIPVGAQVPMNEAAHPSLLVHGGRAYLVQTTSAAGYQGYPGPAGWRGQVMAPVELAFSGKSSRVLDQLEPGVALGLLSHAQRFCPPLHSIVSAADTIRRVVWNGQVMTGGRQDGVRRLKTVLEQIGETGARTNEVFTQSIRDLYGTVLLSSMRDNEYLTQLLVDLLDRNLYERANDCRWWAQAPELRSLMADVTLNLHTPQHLATAQRILEHINSLYTVYTRLMVYDRQGRVLASSHAQLGNGSSVVGTPIEADTLAAVLQLGDTQSYHVTPWRPSVHYDGGCTYVYHAAIRAPGDDTQIVGGVGIVFNAADEFHAMLQGSITSKPDTECFFTNRQGLVLSSTTDAAVVGMQAGVPAQMLELPAGESLARVMVYGGHYSVVSCSCTHGYREFKTSDGYRDDVLAFSVQSFGAVQDGALEAAQRRHVTLLNEASTSDGHEMATFFANDMLVALGTAAVVEALPATQIASVAVSRQRYCRGTIALKALGQVKEYVWVFDLGEVLTGRPSTISRQHQVVIAQHEGRHIGLLVSELHSVVTFTAANVFAAPGVGGSQRPLISQLIRANAGRTLVQCLHLPHVMALLSGVPPLAMEDGLEAVA